MKASALRTKTFEAATAAALDTAIQTWIETNLSEQTFVDLQFIAETGFFAALLTYTE